VFSYIDIFPYWPSVTVGHEDKNKVFGFQAARFIFLIFLFF